jgi:hypothetical protein
VVALVAREVLHLEVHIVVVVLQVGHLLAAHRALLATDRKRMRECTHFGIRIRIQHTDLKTTIRATSTAIFTIIFILIS